MELGDLLVQAALPLLLLLLLDGSLMALLLAACCVMVSKASCSSSKKTRNACSASFSTYSNCWISGLGGAHAVHDDYK